MRVGTVLPLLICVKDFIRRFTVLMLALFAIEYKVIEKRRGGSLRQLKTKYQGWMLTTNLRPTRLCVKRKGDLPRIGSIFGL